MVGRVRSLAMRHRVLRSPALSGLRRTFAKRSSVKHAELSEFVEAEPHRSLRHRSPFVREHASSFAQPQAKQITIWADTAQFAEGSRQRPLVDPGNAG